MISRLTPNLIVDSIEEQLDFWVRALGFEIETTVPQGDSLGFAILKHGNVELMLQSRDSVAEDVPNLAEGAYRTALFLEVDNLDELASRVASFESVCERRKTFYGADEVIVFDPAGNVVTLAQFDQSTSQSTS